MRLRTNRSQWFLLYIVTYIYLFLCRIMYNLNNFYIYRFAKASFAFKLFNFSNEINLDGISSPYYSASEFIRVPYLQTFTDIRARCFWCAINCIRDNIRRGCLWIVKKKHGQNDKFIITTRSDYTHNLWKHDYKHEIYWNNYDKHC